MKVCVFSNIKIMTTGDVVLKLKVKIRQLILIHQTTPFTKLILFFYYKFRIPKVEKAYITVFKNFNQFMNLHSSRVNSTLACRISILTEQLIFLFIFGFSQTSSYRLNINTSRQRGSI